MTDVDNNNPPKPIMNSNRNCIELITAATEQSSTIHWILEDASMGITIADGTIQPDNETTSTTTACWDEQLDFECASLDISNSTGPPSPFYSGPIQVKWNNTVWADRPFDYRQLHPLDYVWIGDGCHKKQQKYHVCGYDVDLDNTWLLDVELTTSNYYVVNNDTESRQVYWRVYADLWDGWGNILLDPYRNRRYKPETTYRTLQCLQRDFGGCTEFGLSRSSEELVANLTLRVDGNIKTNDDSGWECRHKGCENDIVTPLRGCSSSRAFTDAQIAGIVIAVVTPVVLMGFAWAWYRSHGKKASDRRDNGDVEV